MRKTVRSYMILVFAALVMQGCAQSDEVRPSEFTGAGPVPASASPGGAAAVPIDADNKVAVGADTKERFDAVAAAVRKEMSPGGRFEFVSGLERRTVDARLADMRSLFDQFGMVDKMDADSKIRLFNDQEKINGILTRNDGNRLVCTREVPVGTHSPKWFAKRTARSGASSRGIPRFSIAPVCSGPNPPSGRRGLLIEGPSRIEASPTPSAQPQCKMCVRNSSLTSSRCSV